jgi:enoyl-CoA hydratase/carnithine racemase
VGFVRIDKKGKVAVLTLNRPEKKNSLSPEFTKEIDKSLSSLEGSVVVIFRGEGGFFSAGGDLSIMYSISGDEATEFSKNGNEFMDRIENFPGITIAAVEGGAYGGGLELALSCDFRIASPQTKIGLTEINLGIFPGWGGMKRIAKIAGSGVARYVALTGKILDGNEAYRLGLITLLSDDPLKYAMEMAESLSQKSLESIRRIKELLGRTEYSSDLEAKLFGEVLETAPARAALEKFLKK